MTKRMQQFLAWVEANQPVHIFPPEWWTIQKSAKEKGLIVQCKKGEPKTYGLTMYRLSKERSLETGGA